jgi:hypothetical protein
MAVPQAHHPAGHCGRAGWHSYYGSEDAPFARRARPLASELGGPILEHNENEGGRVKAFPASVRAVEPVKDATEATAALCIPLGEDWVEVR